VSRRLLGARLRRVVGRSARRARTREAACRREVGRSCWPRSRPLSSHLGSRAWWSRSDAGIPMTCSGCTGKRRRSPATPCFGAAHTTRPCCPGALWVAGYLGERLVRRRLGPSGWEQLESPLLVVAIGLAVAMAALGLGLPQDGVAEHDSARTRVSPCSAGLPVIPSPRRTRPRTLPTQACSSGMRSFEQRSEVA
jgi:hypothetical protein